MGKPNLSQDPLAKLEIIAEIQAKSTLTWEYLHGLSDEELLKEYRKHK